MKVNIKKILNKEFKGSWEEYKELEPVASAICDSLFPNIYPPTEKFNVKGKIIRVLHTYGIYSK